MLRSSLWHDRVSAVLPECCKVNIPMANDLRRLLNEQLVLIIIQIMTMWMHSRSAVSVHQYIYIIIML